MSAWKQHCKEMNELYDVEAKKLTAAGWKKSGKGINQSFTRNGQTVVLVRELGTNVWYPKAK